MKVVLFCGGLGLRIRDYSQTIPKPMVKIGSRPILWHLMKYYAHFGHREFILCLGHQANVIKDYFSHCPECCPSEVVLADRGRNREPRSPATDRWSITFVDTGLSSNVGQRLKAVQPLLDGEEVFQGNYSDNLTDFFLPTLIDTFLASDALATFLSVKPHHSFHIVRVAENDRVSDISSLGDSGLFINGGFFVFRQAIFDYLREGEDLVHEPFQRLITLGKLTTRQYDGFWACMDTLKEKRILDDLDAGGEAPWEIWRGQAGTGRSLPASAKGHDRSGRT